MTDQKKTTGKSGTKAKRKLQVNKETLKDLNSLKNKAAAVKGGARAVCCGTCGMTRDDTRCNAIT